eukprot:m.111453 g.111453  ORF g.111453 m.111453 type:complete len:91 (+) comp16118_c0_seq2:1961-2233(+)
MARKDVERIILAGGGKLLHREPKSLPLDELPTVPFHADDSLTTAVFVIHSEWPPPVLPKHGERDERVLDASIGWLLDCVSNFKLSAPPAL